VCVSTRDQTTNLITRLHKNFIFSFFFPLVLKRKNSSGRVNEVFIYKYIYKIYIFPIPNSCALIEMKGRYGKGGNAKLNSAREGGDRFIRGERKRVNQPIIP